MYGNRFYTKSAHNHRTNWLPNVPTLSYDYRVFSCAALHPPRLPTYNMVLDHLAVLTVPLHIQLPFLPLSLQPNVPWHFQECSWS